LVDFIPLHCFQTARQPKVKSDSMNGHFDKVCLAGKNVWSESML